MALTAPYLFGDIPQVVHRVVDQVSREGVDRETGAIPSTAGALPGVIPLGPLWVTP